MTYQQESFSEITWSAGVEPQAPKMYQEEWSQTKKLRIAEKLSGLLAHMYIHRLSSELLDSILHPYKHHETHTGQ
jgi:hypothetical protein